MKQPDTDNQKGKHVGDQQPLTRTILLFSGCLVLAAIFLSIDLSIPLGVAGGIPYIAVILVSLWVPGQRVTIGLAILCSLLTVFGYFYSPPGGEHWKVLFNRGLALFAIWVTTVLSLQRRSAEQKHQVALQEKEAAMDNLKILKGLLPICASCKKIRDDSGYWKQLEVYLHEHSEADFSHSICPECTEELYPEVAAKLKAKS